MNTNDQEQVRKTVCECYANAVAAPAPVSRGAVPVQKGNIVKLAGYQRAELEKLPPEAVINSFGCGNPVAFSEVEPGDVVLDLGCGAGIDILLAARKTGPTGRAIGVDMTDEMLEKARETIAASGLANVEVRKGLIEDLPVESDSVDWVISNCVINLSPDKEQVFAEIARVLKRGGRMLVSDVVAEGLPESARDDLELYCSCVAGAISEEEYLAGLKRAGLVDAEVRERIAYDRAQVEGLIEAGSKAAGRDQCCCGSAESVKPIGELASECKGAVWSAMIFARKPA